MQVQIYFRLQVDSSIPSWPQRKKPNQYLNLYILRHPQEFQRPRRVQSLLYPSFWGFIDLKRSVFCADAARSVCVTKKKKI